MRTFFLASLGTPYEEFLFDVVVSSI